MWDNFARLTALLAKVRVWFNNSTIYIDFLAPRGANLAKPPTLRHCQWGNIPGAERRGAGRQWGRTSWGRRSVGQEGLGQLAQI